MKHLFLLFITTSLCIFFACGPGSNEKKARHYLDSIARVDSMKKHMPTIESWDLFKLGLQNEAGLKNKYGNKRIRVKNLVLDNIMADYKTMQCLAYSPADSMLSGTSMQGNKAKKVTEWIDIVNGTVCKYNPDMTYYFELQFTDPLDSAMFKQRVITEEPFIKKSYYSSVLTVEGDSIGISNGTFYLKNCAIAEDIKR